MREIKPNLTPEIINHIGSNTIPSSSPFYVNTYRELVEHVAKLAYLNKDNLIFFRGQTSDYLNKAGNTTLYPSIYRGDYIPQKELEYRYSYLESAGKVLAELFEKENIEGFKDVKRKNYIQWSILQHYEIYQTPLLDLTQSLRVACTFALLNNQNSYGYVYILGLPYITNRISINSEHDIVNIRLLSICPPHALRPYFQEGFVAGTTDITTDYENKNELDFKNRLIAKFQIPTNVNFWGNDFNIIPENALYPPDDQVLEICKRVKDEVNTTLKPGEIGKFLSKWSEIENLLLQKTQHKRSRQSISEALKIIQNQNLLETNIVYQIDKLRRFRNELVHRPKKVQIQSLIDYFNILDSIIDILKKVK